MRPQHSALHYIQPYIIYREINNYSLHKIHKNYIQKYLENCPGKPKINKKERKNKRKEKKTNKINCFSFLIFVNWGYMCGRQTTKITQISGENRDICFFAIKDTH